MNAHAVFCLLKLVLLTAILVPVTVRDLRQRTILNRDVLLLGAGGLLLTLTEAFLPLIRSPHLFDWSVPAAGAAGFGLGLLLGLLCRLAVGDGLGAGDAKLMAALGLTLGFLPFLQAMAVTGVLSLAVSLFLLLTKKRTRNDFLPFAPFLSAGAVTAAVVCLKEALG